jgi:hypothetical protein
MRTLRPTWAGVFFDVRPGKGDGPVSCRVSGRAAAIIGLVAAHADRINAIPVGKLVASFAQGQVKLELVESLPAVRLDAKR